VELLAARFREAERTRSGARIRAGQRSTGARAQRVSVLARRDGGGRAAAPPSSRRGLHARVRRPTQRLGARIARPKERRHGTRMPSARVARCAGHAPADGVAVHHGASEQASTSQHNRERRSRARAPRSSPLLRSCTVCCFWRRRGGERVTSG
jgi:hypothetical protein